MTNSSKLNASPKGGGDLRARPDGAVEPGVTRSGGLSGEGRDLNREGQQFTELLRGRSRSPLPSRTGEEESLTDGSTAALFPLASADAVEPPRRFAPPLLSQGGEKILDATLKDSTDRPTETQSFDPPLCKETQSFDPPLCKETQSFDPPLCKETQSFDSPLCKRGVRGDSGPVADAPPFPLPFYERREVSAAGILIEHATQNEKITDREKPSIADPILSTPAPLIAEREPPKSLNAPAPWTADRSPAALQELHQPDDSQTSDSKPLFPSGDRILQGLLGLPTVPAAPPETAPPDSGSDRINRIEQLADRLAQRILVADRAHATDSEVRIQLRETVLHGAEITIRRDEGQLVVSFNVAAAPIAQQLSLQTDDLQRALATRLDTSVRVEVNVSSQDAGNQGSSSDGRSRNRHDPRDAWDLE